MNKHIIESFNIKEETDKIQPIGSGHINDTYAITLKGHVSPSYILQRINHNIFPNIEKLSDNIYRATNHLEENGNGQYQVMKLVNAIDGKLYHQSADGYYWRLFTHIPNSFSFDLAPSNNFAAEAGKAFGWFVRTLSDLNEPPLYEVIPGFHSLGLRITQLQLALEENIADRAKGCKQELDFYLSRCSEMLEFDDLIGTPEIPLRVTHNDTKINNVLFSSSGKAISIIDLDTVMPGVVHYDFGDAIRTIAANALEDETRLELVGINTELYKAFTEGFLGEMNSLLTSKERYYLPKSPRMMAYIMGIRFLADYLRGDNYYKVKHSDHNIQRARNQMVLIMDMEKKVKVMNF
ncbi:MAG: aminoglycoside phosphotransferase family protein [Bacteroidales bacterium]|nr:MAG: aminoglycoside phosphotransferase family protein [Bacteroidales bacterium]